MRWILPSLVALTLAAGTLRADPESPPTPGDIAEWIRAGTEADLERAAQASERLDAVALRQVIAEVRDQSRVHASLERRKIKGVQWEDISFDQAVAFLRTITGFSHYVSPAALRVVGATPKVTLQLDGASMSTTLDLLTKSAGLCWRVRGGVVIIDARAEGR